MQDRHTDTGRQPSRAQHGATHPLSQAAPVCQSRGTKGTNRALCCSPGPTVPNRDIKPHIDFFSPPPALSG